MEQEEFEFMVGYRSRVAKLREAGRMLRSAARAPATQQNYDSDWRHFTAWCKSMGKEPLPATAETLLYYIAEYGYYSEHEDPAAHRVSTIARRLAAIADRHRKEKQPDPTKYPEVAEMMRGLRRLRRSDHRPTLAKIALTVEDLGKMAQAARERKGVLGARDPAILLVGFAGGFRRSELAALHLGDLRKERDGYLITVRRSKTDQEGEGREVPIPHGKRAKLCPVRALEKWIRERGQWPGPLFCSVSGYGALQRKGITGLMIWHIVKRAADDARLDASKIAPHSLRAGLVTAASEDGRSDSAIMLVTGHRSVETLARYRRHKGNGALKSSPARGLL
jgi:integrase